MVYSSSQRLSCTSIHNRQPGKTGFHPHMDCYIYYRCDDPNGNHTLDPPNFNRTVHRWPRCGCIVRSVPPPYPQYLTFIVHSKAIVPLYNGETAPKSIRGMMIVLYQLQIIVGIFLSCIIDLATHTIANSASWRIPVGLQILWGLILLSGILFLPESPWVASLPPSVFHCLICSVIHDP